MDNFSWANCQNIGLIESGCKIGAAGKLKSFSVQQFFKNAAEVWASSPHLRSKLILQSVFPVAIAFFETCQFGISCFYETKLQIQTRQRGNCSTLAGKSRGGTPFCRTGKTVLSKEVALRKIVCIWFGRIASLSACVLFTGGCVVRIAYVSFLDYSLQEVSLFLRWRTANCLFLLDFNFL